MSNRNNEFDVSCTLTAYLLFSYLNTTTVADNALIADTLIFSTSTFKILGRTEIFSQKRPSRSGL